MKKWIAHALALILLAGTLCCMGFAVGTSTPPPAVQPPVLAVAPAPKAAGTLSITLTDCDSVEIREIPGGTLGLSSDSSNRFRTNIGRPSGGVTAITVNQILELNEGRNTDRPLLTIPQGIYANIVVNLDDSGVALYPTIANYRITAEDSAYSVQIPQGYRGTLDMKANESACSLAFVGQMQNATLKLSAPNSTIGLPKGWALDSQKTLTLTQGTGAAKFNWTFTGCSVSVSEGTNTSGGKYTSASASIAVSDWNTGEILLGPSKNNVINTSNLSQKLKEMKAASKPNTVSSIKNIPAAGISTLQVNSRFCGVAVEPSKSGQFELSYVGVADPNQFVVTSSIQGGVLTVTAERKTNALAYLNTSPDYRVNTVRIGVPAGVLQGLRLDCGASNVLISNLDLPIEGREGSGLLRLLSDNPLTKTIRMESSNGSILVSAKSVTGAVSLSTENGSVSLNADSVTGNTFLSAENGSVNTQVDRLKNAVLTAENGSVNAVVGTVGERVSAGVENGTLNFTLTRTPKDLTFHVKSDWYDNWNDDWDDDWDDHDDWDDDWDDNWDDNWDDHDDWDRDHKSGWYGSGWGKSSGEAKSSSRDYFADYLPTGWYDGYTVGSGKPVLELSVENGSFNFSLGPVKK